MAGGLWATFPFADAFIMAATEVTTEVSNDVLHLIKVISGEMNRQQLQLLLGLANAGHFRKHYLAPALAMGVIEMTIPDKPNSRLQQYRLTAKGWEILR